MHGGMKTRLGLLDLMVEEVSFHGSTSPPKSRLKHIQDAGYYPIFINWRSSLVLNYTDHLLHVRQGEVWNKNWFQKTMGVLTAPVYLGTDIARSFARAPMVWSSMIWNDAKTNRLLAREIGGKESIDVAEDISRNPSPDFNLSTGTDNRTKWEMALAGSKYLVTLPTKLLIAPILDGVGTSAWHNMLRQTDLLYHTDDEFHNHTLLPDRARGGLAVFMRKLANHIAQNGGPDQWDITLVGHSMGTIVLNEMIRNFGEVTLSPGNTILMPFNRIVYMASAATIMETEHSVLLYLVKNTDAHFYNLMLHRTAERRETNVFDLSPRGSLLVWLDDFLSNPLTHRSRMQGRFDDVMLTAHEIPKSLRGRIHLTAFNAGKVKGAPALEPQEHGEFSSRLKFWDETCWKISGTVDPDCLIKK